MRWAVFFKDENMDSWSQNILWGGAALITALTLYMLYAHQSIRWQRERGLVARQSHGLYWATLEFVKKYALGIGIVVIASVGILLYKAQSAETGGPRIESLEIEASKKLSQAAAEEAPAGEIESWTLRLEERRREFPEEYCSRINRGIAAFEQAEEASSEVTLKLRHLRREHQNHCPE